MVYELTLEAVKAAAREAYLAGGLGFQTGEIECEYVGSETSAPCAVGAALPTYVAAKLVREGRNGHAVGALIREGYLAITAEDLPPIARIQSAHDILVQSVRDGLDTAKTVQRHENAFRALIDLPEED